MTKLLLVCIIIFLAKIRVSFGILYGGKFFDPNNHTYAECYLKKTPIDYKYLGNVDQNVDGVSCVPWKDVTDSWFPNATKEKRRLMTFEENFHHSKCRILKLKEGHPMTLDVPDATKLISNGSSGPWCFVENHDINIPRSHVASVCFEKCDESKPSVGMRDKMKDEHAYTIQKVNYNVKLIDAINDIFSEYDLGSLKYYTYKKSQEQPPYYLELRRNVFFALCFIFLFVITWIISCYFLKKHSQKMHRQKQEALNEFYDSTNLADLKLQSELRREQEDA